jgi:hypothetical protein
MKRELQANGLKPQDVPKREIVAFANDCIFEHHAALLAQTWELVQREPDVRELYNRGQRK